MNPQFGWNSCSQYIKIPIVCPKSPLKPAWLWTLHCTDYLVSLILKCSICIARNVCLLRWGRGVLVLRGEQGGRERERCRTEAVQGLQKKMIAPDKQKTHDMPKKLVIYCVDIFIQSLKLSSSSSSSRSRSSKSSPRSKSSLSFPNLESSFVSFSRGFSGLVSGSISPAVKTWL